MNKCNISVALILIFFLFSGCSEDTANTVLEIPEKAELSFSAVFKDVLAESSKQESENFPECSNELPAFLEVVITKNNIPVVGTFEVPLKIRLNPEAQDRNNDGVKEYSLNKTQNLELEPGNYTLEKFSVLNAAGQVIRITPKIGQTATIPVNKNLPYQFSLAPGKEKHLEVDVVCVNNLLAIIPVEYEALKFCIFGTFCNENGRQAEAMRIIVSLWEYSGNAEEPRGTLLYDNVPNEIIVTDYFTEEYSETVAEPLCFAVPNTAEFNEFYLEITLGSGFGYSAEERIIRKGVITEEDIMALFDGADSLDYYHIREGNCNLTDTPGLLEVVETHTDN